MGELEDTRRDIPGHFMGHHILIIIEQLMKTMFLDYQSLTVVILVSTFGHLVVVLVNDILELIVLVIMEDIPLLLLLVIIIIVNLVQWVTPVGALITSMMYYGMEQDVQKVVVVTTLPNLGSIVN